MDTKITQIATYNPMLNTKRTMITMPEDVRTEEKCICVDFINNNPDPVANPDCPVPGHGTMWKADARNVLPKLTKAVTWDEAMQGRERDFNRRYYGNVDGEPRFPHEGRAHS